MDCALNPCHNEGTCIEEAFGYKCKCLQEFTGDDCDTGWISNVLFLFDNLFCALIIVPVTFAKALVTSSSKFYR